MRLIYSTCKKCRRAGVKLFLKGEKCFSQKCPMIKRNYPPGMHGPKLGSYRKGLSKYGEQLMEKQKIKWSYGITERQLKNYYKKAIKSKGLTPLFLLRFLELRLDNIIFRCGFTSSRRQARELIRHNHILVNGKKISMPNFQVNLNDVISIRPSSLNKNYFKNLLETIKNYKQPHWLELDKNNLTCKVIKLPEESDVEFLFDISKVIDFYSR